MAERDTHHTPVGIVVSVDIFGINSYVYDAEYHSCHRRECADDVEAQAAIHLKKTQKVRVREENHCRRDKQRLNECPLT